MTRAKVMATGLAGVVVIGAIVWGVGGWWRAGSAQAKGMPQFGNVPLAVKEQVAAFSGAPVEGKELQRRTADVVRAKLAGKSVAAREADRIAMVVGEAVEALASGDGERYIKLLQSQGLTTDRPMLKEGAGDALLIKGQPMDLEHLDVVLTVSQGRQVPLSEMAPVGEQSVSIRTAPRGEKDVADPVTARTDAIEVIIPGKLRGIDGEFVGRFGVVLARRPSDGQWIIISYTARGVPQEIRAALPPL